MHSDDGSALVWIRRRVKLSSNKYPGKKNKNRNKSNVKYWQKLIPFPKNKERAAACNPNWPVAQGIVAWFVILCTGAMLLILLIRELVQLSIEIRPLARYFTVYSLFGNRIEWPVGTNGIVTRSIRWILSCYVG